MGLSLLWSMSEISPMPSREDDPHTRIVQQLRGIPQQLNRTIRAWSDRKQLVCSSDTGATSEPASREISILSCLLPVRTLAWGEVWNIWKNNEIAWPQTVAHYRQRGFSSWEAWREACKNAFRCEERSWALYRILRPFEAVPTFVGGPFPFWQREFYRGQEPLTFAQLATLAGVRQDEKVQAIHASFPEATILVGLLQ